MVQKNKVQMQDLASGGACGVWELPQVVGAGCAVKGGAAMLLLGSDERSDPSGVGGLGPPMGLMCAELRGEHKCGKLAADGEGWCRTLANNRRMPWKEP